MALIQPARPEPDEPDGPDGPRGRWRGRKMARYGVPVAVAGIAAATISLVPALAQAGDPSLPSITAEQLLTKIAASQTRTVDGTVKVTTDLGLPSAMSSGAGAGLFGSAGASAPGGSGGSPAAPQAQLTQLLIGTHQLHVAADGPDRQKVSLIEPAAEYSVIHNGTQLWAYDSGSNQAYHSTLPKGTSGQDGQQGRQPSPQDFPATPQAAAQQVLKAAHGTASITVDGTARVAGHSAYELLVTPQHADTTTVGSVRIAVDSKTGVPLKLTLTPKGGGKAVFDVGFTKVDFSAPSASTFTFSPPKGVKVTEGGSAATSEHRSGRPGSAAKGPEGTAIPKGAGGSASQPTVLGQGWDAIAVVTSPAVTGGFGAHGKADGGKAKGGGDASSMINDFGTRVTGSFGSGTMFHTRLLNALLTDKGTMYVGAVTQSALTDAANSAK
jgi:outer membrane lipoprotein-sorting protein